ncbi:DUF5060 domain-containing protein [Persicitalea jodogahamensis]|uniref:DUF5060 domain-containing protein n=1 Tax=Persicitalea jodogahamensis TaxID=402147 RepID=A0A8J3G8X9_9BACT|nr:DUF5060 domain-containing protein [Persicitalea jodogahamensis]GHB62240.1 hypothetical protein GCM10007390_15020 [Persicitalea jodogahamensis]
MKQRFIALLCLCSLFSGQPAAAQTISGEQKIWHKISIDFEGPLSSETALPNPFSYYRLDVTFAHESGSPVLVVPGYFAADGQAANSSATSGNVWRVHFAPSKMGRWNYTVSFRGGENAAVGGAGQPAGYMDGKKGSISVANTDKALPDNRARGRLEYNGTRYLKYAGTGENFIKVGADSPENMLHYVDFDGTLDGYGKLGKEYLQLMKTWEPHAQDADKEVSEYTWKNGKGKNIMGAINYLAAKGQNAFSFLTFSVDGDDGCIYPHIVRNDSLFIKSSQESKSWEKAVHHDRFDCSKLDQWERVLDYAETKGMFLHFKTFENEGVALMGQHELSNDRKLYYRELIARFGHHLALNWNLSEETKVDVAAIRETASYIRSTDPYRNHVVQHTFPLGHGKKGAPEQPSFDYYYLNLVGFQSELTGASLQLQKDDVHEQVKRWVELSAQSGKPWVICNDEQGNASTGVTVDADSPLFKNKLPDNLDEIRHKVLWATLMAGGAGVEYYYGYQAETNDLNAQDHRTRAHKYEQAKIARDFFEQYIPFADMKSLDEATANPDDYVFGKEGAVYAVYMPKGGGLAIDIPAGKWAVQWYNPREGGNLSAKKAFSKPANAPDAKDWVALITKN